MLYRLCISVPLLELLEFHGIAKIRQLQPPAVKVFLLFLQGHFDGCLAGRMLIVALFIDRLHQLDLL